MRSTRWLTLRLLMTLVAAVAAAAATVSTASVHFYPDDPLAREPDPSDAGSAKEENFFCDAWLVERMGGTVRVVESTPANLKVTTPHDLAIAEHLLADRLPPAPPA